MFSTYKKFPTSFDEWFKSSSTLKRIPLIVKQREEKILWQKRLQSLDQGRLGTIEHNDTSPQVLVLDSQEAQYHVLAVIKAIEKELLNEVIDHYMESSIAIQDPEWNKQEERRRTPIPSFTKPIPYRSLPQLLATTEIGNKLVNYTNLVALDLETDGIGHNCNILQISLIKLQTDKRSRIPIFEDFTTYTLPYQGYQVNENGEAFQVNEIDNNTISQAPLFKDIITDILEWTKGATLVGFNIHTFDLPILQRHLNKISPSNKLEHVLTIDLAQSFWKYHPRTLHTALCTYNSPMAKEDLHNAYNDAYASFSLLSKMVEKGEMPTNSIGVRNLMMTIDNEGSRKGQYIMTLGPSAQTRDSSIASSLTPVLPPLESPCLKRKRTNEG
jgi:DNA polymerase III epsilon subunit-like protein